jgi:predicted dehydrogenase
VINTMETIHWGILGTGWIADKFAQGLAVLPDAELVAVGSRTADAAKRFAKKFEIPFVHASYEALANDRHVDVVYVATPHPMHKENSLLALRAGRAVLCEKPFTMNAAEAEKVIRFARENKLFLMEAMWTRYLPLTIRLRRILADGVIGDVQMLVADLGVRKEFDPQHRQFAPELGGGALLDLGVYAVSYASMVFGPPSTVSTVADLGRSGVDEHAAIILAYDRGQLAALYTSLRVSTPNEVILMGTDGQIRIHPKMSQPSRLTVTMHDGKHEDIEMAYEGNGYNYEADHVMRCLRAGRLESEVMPLDETLAIMNTMDQIRAQWGLRYPMEE